MLKTECPNCKSWVYSPFLSEMEKTECSCCGQPFEVKEVFISAGPYSIYRDVLLKNMHKYLRLLREAREELKNLEARGGQSRGYSESARTVHLFIDRLKELLDGCRDKIRVAAEDTTVEYMLDRTLHAGKLINISATGVCLNAGENAVSFNSGDEISLNIKAPAIEEPLLLRGRVVWKNDECHMGIMFVEMDERQKNILQNFILEKSVCRKT